MKQLKHFIFLLLLSIVASQTLKAQFFTKEQDFSVTLRRHQLINFDFNALHLLSKNQSALNIQLDLGTYGKHQLQLIPSNLLLNDAESFVSDGKIKHLISRPEQRNWMGANFESGPIIRLNIHPNALSGLIETDKGTISLQTCIINKKSQLLVNYIEDELVQPKTSCGTEEHNPDLPVDFGTNNGLTYEDYSCAIAKVGNVAGFKLFKTNNRDTAATIQEMRDILNLTDGIYVKHMKMRIKIAFESISLDSLAAYNNADYLLDRLGDFSNKSNLFNGKIDADFKHLYSDHINMKGSAVGYAYLNGTCRSTNKVSTSVDYQNSISHCVKIQAHEFGHLFGLDHSTGSDCSANSSLMCPALNINNLPFFNLTEINGVLQFISSARNYPQNYTANCLKFPVSTIFKDRYFNNGDSVLINIQLDPEHKATKILFSDNSVQNIENQSSVWLKSLGKHKLIVETDTVLSFKCNYEKEFYIAYNDFVVVNTNVFGKGSLGNAILNSNIKPGLDSIIFNIPIGKSTIVLDTLLPEVEDSCIIDGCSQPGFKYPNEGEDYQPSVVLVDSLRLADYYDEYGLDLLGETYSIRNLGFKGFAYGINVFPANKYNRYINGVWKAYPDSNFTSRYTIQGNRFEDNRYGMYLNGYHFNNSKNVFHVGGDSFKKANFYVTYSSPQLACHTAYSDTIHFKNNYHNLSPKKSLKKLAGSGFSFNQCGGLNITNNYTGITDRNAYVITGSYGTFYGNYAGYNPIEKTPVYFSGYGMRLSYTNDPMLMNRILRVGDTIPSRANVFYGKNNSTVFDIEKTYQPYLRNMYVTGNKIISNDSCFINTVSSFNKMAFDYLVLDSMSYQCGKTAPYTVYGRFKPKAFKDSVYIHFYETEAGATDQATSVGQYLGMMFFLRRDTTNINFTFITSRYKGNKGVVATITSRRYKLTAGNSNVVQPNNIGKIANKYVFDSCLCPNKTLSIRYKTDTKSLWVDDVEVKDSHQLSGTGTHTIKYIKNNGCESFENISLTYFPNYLDSVSIKGPDRYTNDSNTIYFVAPIINRDQWISYQWTIDEGTFTEKEKFFCNVRIKPDSSDLQYNIKDINNCTYGISKKLFSVNYVAPTPSLKGPLSIFPNPGNGKTLHFSEKIETDIFIYNHLGQIIQTIPYKQQAIETIDLNFRTEGIYLIVIPGKGVFRYLKVGN